MPGAEPSSIGQRPGVFGFESDPRFEYPWGPQASLPAMIRHLLFDLDGTLADTAAANFAAYREAFAARGLVLCEADHDSFVGLPLKVFARRLDPQLDPGPLLPPLLATLTSAKDTEQVEAAHAILLLAGPLTWTERE